MTFLEKGVITPIAFEDIKYLSNVFLRPKRDGSFRMILNLSKLNGSIEYEKFKMETLEIIIKMMRPNCFMGSLDLKDAYYSVPIAPEHQAYLSFPWVWESGQKKFYANTCFPNGLSSAPRDFTKLLKPVLATLRLQGITIAMYIDDTFIQDDTEDACTNSLLKTRLMLERLGFVINEKKSMSTPTQQLTMLGFILDSVSMTVKPTPEKIEKITHMCQHRLDNDTCTVRQLSQLIGSLVSLFSEVEYAQMQYRELEKLKKSALRLGKGDFEYKVTLTEPAKRDLLWWIENLLGASRKISHGEPIVTLTTDASQKGWGAVSKGEKTGGPWMSVEAKAHINSLELLAVLFGLKSLFNDQSSTHIRLEIDNTTAVSYINAQGGVVSEKCNQIAVEIWQWAIDRDIWLSATHIPGKLNKEADQASRVFNDRTEWMLNPKVFSDVSAILGRPDIDLFASRLNKQLNLFVSWHPDPEASHIDAFTLSWAGKFNYIFPPFSLINQCLQKLALEQAKALVIVPVWPTQVWFTLLMTILIARPLLLPEKCLLRPVEAGAEPPKNVRLMACLVSGNSSKSKEFQRGLPISSSTVGSLERKHNTRQQLLSGGSFVIRDRNVTLRELYQTS